MNNLIKFWSTTSKVHKEDRSCLKGTRTFKTYKKYMTTYIRSKTHSNDFHLGLIPVPYIGDLRRATIFILMLNPGFRHEDYIAEEHFPSFRKALKDNLKQNKMAYPFLFLNPEFLWTGGGRYWEKRFGVYASEISAKWDIPYGEALAFISRKVACLELVPYHSKHGVNNGAVAHLESVKAMLKFFCSDILPKAKKGEVGLIVARGRRHWEGGGKIREQKNIFVYSKGEERSASIAPHVRKGDVGRMVRKFLLDHGSRID